VDQQDQLALLARQDCLDQLAQQAQLVHVELAAQQVLPQQFKDQLVQQARREHQ
jgi:hypothetical protein